MKIRCNFGGVPILFRTFKKKEFDVEFDGKTLRDLMNDFVRQYGDPVKKALLDDNGDVDIEIRILKNDVYLMEERMECCLEEGDFLCFRGAYLG